VRSLKKRNINPADRILRFLIRDRLKRLSVCSTFRTETPDKIHVAIQMKSSESRPIYILQHQEPTNDLCLFSCNPFTHFCVKFFRSHSSAFAVLSRRAYKSAALMTRRTSRYNTRRRGAQLFVATLHENRMYSRRLLKTKWCLILLNTLNDLSASCLGAYLLANRWTEIYFKTVLGPYLIRQGEFHSY
jgi:hypothetical protein